MLRFTLHRPSQNSAVSTRCHAMSCRDIHGRVHVGVCPVPAGHPHEGRLALATLVRNMLAGVTGLRRVRSFDLLDPARCFLFQPGHEKPPPGLKEAPVEPGLLCDVPARLLHGSPRISSHAFDVEVLNTDHIKPTSEVRAGLLGPVFAPAAILGLQSCDQSLHLFAAVRPAPSTGESALQPQEAAGFLPAQPARTGDLASGQRPRDSDAAVPPDDAARAGCGHRVGDHGEHDMPTARPVTRDAVRLPASEGAAAFELHPADLRDQQAAACPVVLPDPQRLRADNPQALMLAGFTPPRAPVGAIEEPLPCLVEVAQRLLLDRLRPGSQPRRRSPGFGQLCGLGIEPRRGPFPAPPHQALLQAEVPHVSGVAALLQQEYFLCGARIQAEPHSTQRSGGLRHPDGKQTPILAVVAASPATCTSTWCSPPSTAVACSTRRCSTCANTSWRRCVRTSGRPWPSSTENKTTFTYSCSTRPRWRSPTSPTPSKASHPGGYGRPPPTKSTRLRPAAGSGPRHTSPDHAVPRHCPQRSEEHTSEPPVTPISRMPSSA